MGFLDRFFSKRTYDTLFGTVSVMTIPDTQGRRVRVMELDGTFQSASLEGNRWAELPFEYFRRFDAIFEAELPEHPIRRVLLLGGGGFAWPKHALTTHQDLMLDVVEIDPRIIQIARKHFYLDRLEAFLADTGESTRLRIIEGDAAVCLAGREDVYDAIINDVYQGARMPDDVVDALFLSHIKAHLAPGGIYAMNVVADLSRTGSYALFSLMNTLNDAFRHVCALDATDPEFGGADNYIILASDAAYRFTGALDYSFE